MTITLVPFFEDETYPSDARVRWLSITPWNGASFKVHVSIPGGVGLGKEYRRGKDNRVATLQGIVFWNDAGQSFLDWLGGEMPVKVNNGISEVKCMTDSAQITEYGGAWIKFTVTLTEVQ